MKVFAPMREKASAIRKDEQKDNQSEIFFEKTSGTGLADVWP